MSGNMHPTVASAGSILLSQGCKFGNSQLQHREMENFCSMEWPIFPSPHSATASIMSPCTVLSASAIAKASHKISRSFMERCNAYLVC